MNELALVQPSTEQVRTPSLRDYLGLVVIAVGGLASLAWALFLGWAAFRLIVTWW